MRHASQLGTSYRGQLYQTSRKFKLLGHYYRPRKPVDHNRISKPPSRCFGIAIFRQMSFKLRRRCRRCCLRPLPNKRVTDRVA